MAAYNHQEIEKKWQAVWEKNKAFAAVSDAKKEKRYVLDMFPYPSGAGLHVGHPMGYIGTDIISRKMRMEGFNVLHPMGWDAFGLPAENYAIKTGVHPAVSTAQNAANFRRQLKILGLSYDWDREISSCDPEYYKWTQWLFLEFFKQGLAYKKKAAVNWCEKDQTVLANEQVVNGACERCGTPVIQKQLEQWFFGITKFADRLLAGLDGLDWPEKIKAMQRNWIGKSEGAEIAFGEIRVFTTRPDTLMGVSYVVLSPEHALVDELTTAENKAAMDAYRLAAKGKSELERTQLEKDKSGVFTGSFASHPITGEPVQVWVSDYVLTSYGTGAVMGVPAEDERDAAFAQKYDLEVRPVDTTVPLPAFQKVIKYRLRDWLVSRQRYWGAPIPIVYDPEGKAHAVEVKHLPLLLPTDVDYLPKGTSPIGSSKTYVELAEKLYGKGWRFETDTMDTFVDSSWYFLRFTDPKNAEEFASRKNIDQWCPVDVYVGGAEHAVLHLLYARFFTYVLHDLGYVGFEEPFLSLRNQGLILGPDGQKMSKSKGNVINPDEMVSEFGADALRVYEMFMAPFEDVKPWDTKGLIGTRRFLDKAAKLAERVSDAPDTSALRAVHKAAKKVTEDISAMRFNTAVSALMICTNSLQESETVPREAFEIYLRLLAPLAPHLAEELWSNLGNKKSVFESGWPTFDAALVKDDVVAVAVQVNGKLRGTIQVAPDLGEAEAIKLAGAEQNVVKHLEGKTVLKTIYKAGKMVNFVVKE